MIANHGVKQARVVSESENGGAEFGRYAGIVYWMAWFITEDNADAEDVLQRTFLKADLNPVSSRQSVTSILPLLQVALNESFAKLRNRDASKLLRLSLEAGMVASFVPEEVVEWSNEAEERYSREELQKLVNDVIRNLTPFSRVVFLLRDVAKLQIEEIAELFHLSATSVKSHSLRSRMQLREHLNPYFMANVKEATRNGKAIKSPDGGH